MKNPFEQHLHDLGHRLKETVERAVYEYVASIEGKPPALDEMVQHGQLVSIEGWGAVTFFLWKKAHALSYVIEPDDKGTELRVRIARLNRYQWPEALVKYVTIDPAAVDPQKN